MNEPVTRRFAFLDAMRGILAVWVFLFHMSVSGNVDHIKAALPAFLAQFIFEWGELRIPVFFVISGFVIANAINQTTQLPVYFRRFFARRTLRIIPTYYASVAAVVLLSVLSATMHHQARALPSWPTLLEHLTFTQGLLHTANLNVVYWTLCIEIQFYAAIALLLFSADWIQRRYPESNARLVFILLAYVVSLGWPAGIFSDAQYPGTFLPYWFSFLTGVLTFWYLRKGGWSGAFLLFGGLILVLSNYFSGHRFALVTVLASALIIVAAKTGNLGRWLNYRGFQAVGAWSYPFFLMHVPVTTIYLSFSRRLLTGSLGLEILNLALAVTVNLVVSALMYRFIDEPGIRLSRSVSLKAIPAG